MKFFIYTLVLLSLCSCLNEGTDTGNPGIAAPTSGDENTIITGSRLNELTATVCFQLSACEAELLVNCSNAIYSQTNIDEEIGLSVGAYSDLEAVAAADTNGGLTLIGTSLDQCKTDIYALSCALPEVVNAYDPLQTNAYEGVATMLPTSCEGIF